MAGLSKELKDIKKKYGETFMHICRDNFASLLETEGLLTQVLDRYFAANSKSIGNDIINSGKIIDFKDFIYSKIDVEKEEKQIIEDKTPYEILDEAGYKLIECTTEEEIQEFEKYYAPDEVICTIYNGGRLDSSVIFFAVKEDAENIKREDFKKPQREDEYGASVLGIQFDKYGTCTPHIITRYNHTVNNPNSTFGNDLDRIAPGLTESFAKLLHERGLELNNTNIEEFELPGYTVAGDGKYYKYNMEIDGKYYCPGNIIIGDGEVRKIEKTESQMLIDYFILDIEKKTFKIYDDSAHDSFLDTFKNIEKIQIEKNPDKEKQTRIITVQIKDSNSPITIEIDKDNNIVGYNNQELKEVGDDFLCCNTQLSELNLPGLTEVGDDFLCCNTQLKKLNFPNLTEVGDDFLLANRQLSELNLPGLTEVGDCFLFYNQQLSELNLPGLTEVGDDFLSTNEQLSELNLPKLTEVGDDFLKYNEQLSELNLPKLTTVGISFLARNKQLRELNLPELTEVGDYFLCKNEELRELNLPQLTKVGDYFLGNNEELRELNLPQLTEVGNDFLCYNNQLSELNLLELTKVGDYFLIRNKQLSELYLPQLTEVGKYFLRDNNQLGELNLPELKEVGDYFLCNNEELIELNLPELKEVGDYFLCNNEELRELNLPQLTEVGNDFLCYNNQLSELNLPELTKVGDYFLCNNCQLSELYLPQLTEVGKYFLRYNNQLSELNLAELTKVGDYFLCNNCQLSELYLPQLEKKGDDFLKFHPRKKELIDNMYVKKEEKKEINPKEIAELDRDTELTNTEVNLGKELIEKSISNKKDNIQK